MNEITLNDMPNPNEMEMLMKYCEVIAQAPAYAAMGGMPGVFALVMSARELGIGPMAALNGGMYLIPPSVDKEGKPKGQPTIMMAARTMNMMILKAGHMIEEIENVEGRVTLKGTRKDNGNSMTVTYTLELAKRAGLSHDMYGKPKLWSSWFKNMDDMLWKTCLSKLARRLFADVIGNAYEPSEFEEKEHEEKKLLVKPEKKALTGKNIFQIDKKIELKESFEEFKTNLRIDPLNVENQDINLMDYIKNIGLKKSLDYHEMLEYCYNHKSSFMQAYDLYKLKLGLNSEIED